MSGDTDGELHKGRERVEAAVAREAALIAALREARDFIEGPANHSASLPGMVARLSGIIASPSAAAEAYAQRLEAAAAVANALIAHQCAVAAWNADDYSDDLDLLRILIGAVRDTDKALEEAAAKWRALCAPKEATDAAR